MLNSNRNIVKESKSSINGVKLQNNMSSTGAYNSITKIIKENDSTPTMKDLDKRNLN